MYNIPAEETNELVNDPVETFVASRYRKGDPPFMIPVIAPFPPKHKMSEVLAGVPLIEMAVPFGTAPDEVNVDWAPNAS